MNEQWREISGYNDWYEVSNLGRVRSWHRRGRHPGRSITPHVVGVSVSHGYPRTRLNYGDGSFRYRSTHNLVLEAFVGPCPAGFHGAHLDGNPSNAGLDNLAWVTPKENASHRVLHGTHICGEDRWSAKLMEADVLAIRTRLAAGESATSIAVDYPVTRSAIYGVKNRTTWTHVA